MNGLRRSVHSSVETVTEISIISPPMVGVPCFLACASSRYSRILLALPCLDFSQRIIGLPIIRHMTSAVRIAPTVRNDR